MASEPAPDAARRPAVVLVHGLWMPALVMLPLQWRLQRAGFAVRRFAYASLRGGLESNARALAGFVAGIGGAQVQLVGHSLGGLVVLAALAMTGVRVRRAVLMGSPVAGCHCAAFALRSRLLSRLVGRSLRDWSTAPPTIPPAVAIGVLAGRSPWGIGRLVPGLPRPNDGVVALDETRLPAASDAVCLAVSHSQMLLSARAARQVASFLRSGRFLND